MFGLLLGVTEGPVDFRAYCAGDPALYERMAMGLIERGVMPDSDSREPWFLCYRHDKEIVADTLTAFEEAVKDVKR